MTHPKIDTATKAWDCAEKVLADFGLTAELVRVEDRFYLAADNGTIRIAVDENPPHANYAYAVLYRPDPTRSKLFVFKCCYPPVAALKEMLGLLGYSAHIDGYGSDAPT